jgi:hypothetical protein
VEQPRRRPRCLPPIRPLVRRIASPTATRSPDPAGPCHHPLGTSLIWRRRRHDPRRSVPMVTAYILIQTEVGTRPRSPRTSSRSQACSRPRTSPALRRDRPRRGAQHRRARQAGGRARAGGRRQHQDPHLPGGAPVRAARPLLLLPTATATRVDCGGSRRVAAPEAPTSKTPANGSELRKQSLKTGATPLRGRASAQGRLPPFERTSRRLSACSGGGFASPLQPHPVRSRWDGGQGSAAPAGSGGWSSVRSRRSPCTSAQSGGTAGCARRNRRSWR